MPDHNTPAAGERQKTVRVYVGIGSNIDSIREIAAGLEQLVLAFGPLEVSPAYRSAALGFEGPPFINLVVGFDTGLPLDRLVSYLRHIEQQRDPRNTRARLSSRRLDLDLLLYGDSCGVCHGVELPRSDITNHAHVARPLADIAGPRKHPILQLTFEEISLRIAPFQPLEPVSLADTERSPFFSTQHCDDDRIPKPDPAA